MVVKNNADQDLTSLPIIRQKADSVIDTDNPREVVGFADYFFVAKVIKTVNTEYRHPVLVETTEGMKEVSIPYTIYEIRVLKNIKGELPIDQDIKVTKLGGLMEDNSSIMLSEVDLLPETGKTYIIAASVQPNGEILISGDNTIQAVPDKMLSSNSIDPFDTYTDFYKEEVIFQRKRYPSNFDD